MCVGYKSEDRVNHIHWLSPAFGRGLELELRLELSHIAAPHSSSFLLSSSFLFLLIMCFRGAMAHVWRVENNLWELTLSFHQVGPEPFHQFLYAFLKYLKSS